MKFLGMVMAGALLLAPALAMADDDPYAGWTDQQLKVKIAQLQRENADLKGKLAGAPAGGAVAAAPKATADLLLDDFEGSVASNGQTWWTGSDTNNLGTTLQPQPFAPEKGGDSVSPGHSGRIHGHLGKQEAPWPWANMTLTLSNPDIRGYSALRFWVKGDGGHYRVQLCRGAVKDFAYHAAEFDAPSGWTLVTLPLASFSQPSWGAQVPGDFKDVEKISFMPTAGDKDYDFSIDDVTLAK